MSFRPVMTGCLVGVSCAVALVSAQAPSVFLAPKAAAPAGWVAPNKPWTKLPDVLSKHAGEVDWSEAIVRDELLQADYISMGAGRKTTRRLNAWATSNASRNASSSSSRREMPRPWLASSGLMMTG